MATDFGVPKSKLFPIRPRSPWFARPMQSLAFILAVNWCLQGMRGMDRKELAFRLPAELVLALLLAAAAGWWLEAPMALLSGLVAAHTMSFTLNGQLWVCVRYARFWHREPAALERFLLAAAADLRTRPRLREAVCIGSRGDRGVIRSERSDLDLRLVFPPGARAWLAVNLLLLRLRAEAFLRLIPLDLYAYDSPESLRRFDQRERLLVILDRDGRLATLFPERVASFSP
ncbi:hypothetical protein [Benzoatithermus flavus]|uniref:Polymerase nucleotidyl transferase domain-containing protein n=1 Tax=Benzoatithermus flavus TaxID=3108223 RepID=A0ABU8XQC5_9PROT